MTVVCCPKLNAIFNIKISTPCMFQLKLHTSEQNSEKVFSFRLKLEQIRNYCMVQRAEERTKQV